MFRAAFTINPISDVPLMLDGANLGLRNDSSAEDQAGSFRSFGYDRRMDDEALVGIFSALGQPTRLAAYRLIAAAAPSGMSSGEIARTLDVKQNSLSTHLAILEQSGLVTSERQSRNIIYTADIRILQAVGGQLAGLLPRTARSR